MKKVIVYTQAYNAENTIRRTIDSVINQTHGNFKYYILDNASTDKTGDIIREYASRDRRIVPFYFDVNNTSFAQNCIRTNIFETENFDYFAHLDADDEYLSQFLEKTISFAENNNCETVCVGSNRIDAETGERDEPFLLENDIILTSENFNTTFFTYKSFSCTMWGKLISSDVMLAMNLTYNDVLINTSDELYGIEVFRNSTRIGIMRDFLHNYFLYKKGVRNNWNYKRTRTAEMIDPAMRRLVVSKCGFISRHMEEFIIYYYFIFLKRSVEVLENSDLDYVDKIFVYAEMFLKPKVREYGLFKGLGDSFDVGDYWKVFRNNTFSSVIDFLLDIEDIPDTLLNLYCDLGEFCSEIIGQESSYLIFCKIRLKNCCEIGEFEKAKEIYKYLSEKLPGDSFLEEFDTILTKGN
jgi:glycosyltransferase involved in cell wall biosynthesis